MKRLSGALTLFVTSSALFISCTGVDPKETETPATGGKPASSSGGSDAIGGMGGGLGGAPGKPRETLSERHGAIDSLELGVNFADGFYRFEEETYRVDVKTRKVSFEHVSHGPGIGGAGGASDIHEESVAEATEQQLEALLTAVGSSEWRDQESCLGIAIDGAPYPPHLEVVGKRSAGAYGASDASCAESDHSAIGPVISCADYSKILDALLAIVPEGTDQGCASYW